MKLEEYDSCKRTRGNYAVPTSVQKSIPIDEIYDDGIWRSGDVYSVMWHVSDINYEMVADDKKVEIQQLYGIVYAGIPSDCWAKFCIVSQKLDEESFVKSILYPMNEDGLDDLRKEHNRQLLDHLKNAGNVIQNKYIIVSTNKLRAEDARVRLQHVKGHLLSSLSNLNCIVTQVSNNQRLQIIHNFFRMGEENNFAFDLTECNKLGHDFRDYIAPDSITFKRDHLQFDEHYAKCMSITSYPQRLDDKLIATLLQQVPYIVLSIDVNPVEAEDALKALESQRMKVDADKVRFNRKSVDNLDFTSNIPFRTKDHEQTVNKWQVDMTERDQQMFLTTLTVTYFADSLEELKTETDTLKTTAVNLNCRFTELKWQQEDAFNTAMPYGLRRIENMRTMTTENVAAMIPFNTQEVIVPGGIFYGINAVSGNIINGLRTKLINGNAMVVATSGGGKSMFVKQEIFELMLRFPKSKFYIVDPENEYAPVVEKLGGIVVDISIDSSTYFNPLEYKKVPGSNMTPAGAKCEFVLSLCEHIMGADKINAKDRSLIDHSLKSIYEPYLKANCEGDCPTLTDLWQDLRKQKHSHAEDLALALEIFANGSLNMFAHHTNVDMSNRLICFNIQSLGEQLKPVAMLSMLEFIKTCVLSNTKNDPSAATWVYFDEIYLLLRDRISALFLQDSWKNFRKHNAYATGITQNVEDCLRNDTAYAMLSNSEFVCMLRQTKDIDSVAKLYGLSEPQKKYLLLARPGQGIIKMGNSLIPFENDYPQDSPLYKVFTTKPGEM